jgi:NAD(P)-dependent dehydrogenase (short-subunit alcohol dehydrogenase family)
MKAFKDRVAVVTGAASGIGRAVAERLAAEGMKIVLADIEPDALEESEQQMKANGARVLAVRTDVSKPLEVEALAKETLSAFGAIHVLCNNAGVAAGGFSWRRTSADWEWVLGVNLWGVIHGLRVFVPIMLEQDSEGHIVNTASIAGLTSIPLHSVYQVSKHGVVTLSESLHHEFAMMGAKLKVSVLCPGWVRTQIADSERNRPPELQNDAAEDVRLPEEELFEQVARQFLAEGMAPERVADCVFDAIRDESFWILTHPETKEWVRARAEDAVNQQNPVFDPTALQMKPGEAG